MAKDADNGDRGPGIDSDAHWRAIEEALKPYQDIYGLDFVAEVRSVLWRNHRLGRIARQLSGSPRFGAADYVALVVENYRKTDSRYCALFINRDDSAWCEFLSILAAHGAKFLRARGLYGFMLADVVPEYAQAAIIVILQTPYPFDVDFDAWACVILQNLIRKGARSLNGLHLNGQILYLDEVLDDRVPDSTPRDLGFDTFQTQLLWAIRQLSQEYAEFIQLRYLDGLSYLEIAALLGCRKSTLYDRNKNAMAKLRQILRANGII